MNARETSAGCKYPAKCTRDGMEWDIGLFKLGTLFLHPLVPRIQDTH